ncbi:MAG: phosphohistidine phosphatase SixA [Syntrophorhabdaceae bacterium]|nr:phosphohistidine phosphatase SixA [Syntrophorhabdaceae bacterium]MDD4196538.1 phosphohistidine phosphatase SixA [Syntrophorhabdaceae bacterium]HOC45057.1 phosphohistidine phosphatase SixA [Syntrophorhabdaceae bacterium]
MFLYLVRHGEARQESEDSERGLTDDGMKSARRMGEFLSFMGTELDTVIHSTKKRARETAQAISESLRPKKEMREENGLAPNDDPAVWAARINAMEEDTAIVGHLPFLDRLLGLLVMGDAGRRIIDFKPVGTVCLKPADNGRWLITWVINPEVI